MKSKRLLALFLACAAVSLAVAQTAPAPLHADGAVVSSNGFTGGRYGDIEIVNTTRNRNFPADVWGYKDGQWTYVGSCALEERGEDEEVHYPYWSALDYEYYEVRIPGATNLTASSEYRRDDLRIYIESFTAGETWTEREANDAARATIMQNMTRPADAPNAEIAADEIGGREAENSVIIVNSSSVPSYSVTVYGIDFERAEWELVGTANVTAAGARVTVEGPKADLRRWDDFDYFAISVDGASSIVIDPSVERRDLVVYIDQVNM